MPSGKLSNKSRHKRLISARILWAATLQWWLQRWWWENSDKVSNWCKSDAVENPLFSIRLNCYKVLNRLVSFEFSDLIMCLNQFSTWWDEHTHWWLGEKHCWSDDPSWCWRDWGSTRKAQRGSRVIMKVRGRPITLIGIRCLNRFVRFLVDVAKCMFSVKNLALAVFSLFHLSHRSLNKVWSRS